MTKRLFFVFLCLIPLAACGQGGSDASARDMEAIAARAAELEPADVALRDVYNRSCRLCHGTPGSGAPLTGDGEAWAPRLAQGSQTLLDHTIRGYNGMPPLGMCPDCDLDEFRALIAFISTDASE